MNVLQWLHRVNVLWIQILGFHAVCCRGILAPESTIHLHGEATAIHSNRNNGITAYNKATIHLHGEATKIHSNGGSGIFARSSAKVLIHLPSHHNTIYNNNREDRWTSGGGTITNVED